MKWALASIGLLTLIVVFSLAALNQKNVVWTDGVAHCPHCRSVVNDYSNVCATCNQAFDWETREEPCPACPSELDAAWLRKRVSGREAEIAAVLQQEGLSDAAVKDLMRYLADLESGDCAFCAGTGKWLAPGVGESGVSNGDRNPLTAFLRERLGEECPVCLGSGTCVLCDGNHRVVHARESAALELAQTQKRLELIDPLRDPESTAAAWDLLRGFVSRNVGRHEVGLVTAFDEPGKSYVDRAIRRLEKMKRLVTELP